jgi:2-dehydropantoate 2-reductase
MTDKGNKMKQDILLVGTGALATLFAARLSEAGHSVSMLGTWKQGLHALQKNGARIVASRANGDERAYKVHATDDPREVAGAKYALVLVKSWQTERAARQLKQSLASDGLAVTLQNGLGNRETLAAILRQAQDKPGPARVALGITTTGATLLGPGLVKMGGEGVISLEQNQALGPLEAVLRSSKFNLQIVDDADSLIWGKLVINAAINPLTALLRVPNGELLSRPKARRMMGALAREAADVAEAEHVNLPFSNPVSAAEDVARKTAGNHSSMFQDVSRGAPTEIDAICGAVTRRGAIHGIKTPYNKACWTMVRATVR